ncbi:MAG: hypothetical protein GX264_06675 [Clostridiales bacterium]|jgi:hypothetical protein|nr:hypothetical protein [Clostridiales bacterium]
MGKSLVWSILTIVAGASIVYGIVLAFFSEGSPFGPDEPATVIEAEADAVKAGNLQVSYDLNAD